MTDRLNETDALNYERLIAAVNKFSEALTVAYTELAKTMATFGSKEP